MFALIALFLTIGMFGTLGIIAPTFGPSQFGLLLITVLILTALGYLGARYERPKKLMLVTSNSKIPLFARLWPFGLVVATAVWCLNVQVGLIVLFVALAYAAICFYVLHTNYRKIHSGTADMRKTLKHAPYDIIVHVSGQPDAAYQVNQWLPVLERLPYKIAIISRHLALAYSIKKSAIDTIYAREPEMVSSIISAGAKAVLYPANYMHNTQLMRHTECKHIFINHGESDKVVNQSKFLLSYDHLFVGGQLAKDRLIDAKLPMREDQVLFVGRPQAEMVLNRPDTRGRITNILYAPTWEGYVEIANSSSVQSKGLDILHVLNQMPDLNVVFKPHPFTGIRCTKTKAALKKMKAYCAKNDIPVLGRTDNLLDAMNVSDLLITDVSSVLNDYLVTGKPIILCPPEGAPQDELEQDYPSSRAAYPLHTTDELADLVKSIDSADHLSAQRTAVRTYSLGDYKDGALSEFIKQLEAVV